MRLAATYGVNRIDGLRVRKMVNSKKSYCRMIFFNGFAIEHKLPDFFYLTRICSGGKVRMRAERQNCDSNFSRLARQRRLPATYGVKGIDGLRVRKKVNPKKSYCRMIFF